MTFIELLMVPRRVKKAFCFLLCVCAGTACGSTLRGVTISGGGGVQSSNSDKASFILEMRRRTSPLVFSNSIPEAESLEVVDSGGSMLHVIPAVFGGLVGTRSYNIEADAAEKIAALKPVKEGNILIVDNIKTDLTSGFFSEFWNNYLGAFLVTYEGFSVVYEIAEIDPGRLYEYLHGIRRVENPEPVKEVKPFAVFRGVVHTVSGKVLDIASPQTGYAYSGETITILDRNGKIAGKAKVGTTFHTKIKATLISGVAAKGFSAEIYR